MSKAPREANGGDRSKWTDDELYDIAIRLLNAEAPSRIAIHYHVDQTQIRRAIETACGRGILQLQFFPDGELERLLGERRDGTTFHVVPDELDNPLDGAHAGLDPVSRLGASVIRAQIESELATGKEQIFIGIGGGFTLKKTIDFLDADIHHDPPAGSERLVFVSLNAATPPDLYDRSANFLAVRCAQIYSTSVRCAGHLALVPEYKGKHEERYRTAIGRLSRVIASGGGRHSSFLSTWLEAQGLPIEDHVAGDVAYCPIDHKGQRAHCLPEVEAAIQRLHPQLSYENLRELSDHKKMTLVLSENRGLVPREYAMDAAKQGNGVVAKLEIAQALMEVPLASTIVIGRSLARQLVPTPQSAGGMRTRRRRSPPRLEDEQVA